MIALVDVAVFGLMPVPITYSCRSGDGSRPTTTREVDTSQLASHSHSTTKRTATKDELVRVSRKLEHIGTEPKAR